MFITALYSALAFVGTDPTKYANDALFVPVNVTAFAGAFLALLGLPIAFVALRGCDERPWCPAREAPARR